MYVYFAPLASPTILLHLVTPNNLCTSVLLPPPHPLPSSIWWFISSYSEGKLLHQSLYNPSRQKRVKQIGRCKLNFPTYLFHNLHLGLWIIRTVYKKRFFFFFLYQREYALREKCGTWEIISDRFTAKLKWLQPLHSNSNSAAFGEVCY